MAKRYKHLSTRERDRIAACQSPVPYVSQVPGMATGGAGIEVKEPEIKTVRFMALDSLDSENPEPVVAQQPRAGGGE